MKYTPTAYDGEHRPQGGDAPLISAVRQLAPAVTPARATPDYLRPEVQA